MAYPAYKLCDQSTGSYKSIIVTIVNPKSNDLGYKSVPQRKLNFASNDNRSINFNLIYLLSTNIPGSGKWGDRLRKAKGFSKKCLDAKNKLKDINDFIERPDGYIKGRGFNEGLDFFKAGIKGNKKAGQAFELFRNFNLDLLDAQENKSDRPGKSMKPSDFRFKPGRGDVQPLELVFGCK